MPLVVEDECVRLTFTFHQETYRLDIVLFRIHWICLVLFFSSRHRRRQRLDFPSGLFANLHDVTGSSVRITSPNVLNFDTFSCKNFSLSLSLCVCVQLYVYLLVFR